MYNSLCPAAKDGMRAVRVNQIGAKVTAKQLAEMNYKAVKVAHTAHVFDQFN